jgi:hypothetical protein
VSDGSWSEADGAATGFAASAVAAGTAVAMIVVDTLAVLID